MWWVNQHLHTLEGEVGGGNSGLVCVRADASAHVEGVEARSSKNIFRWSEIAVFVGRVGEMETFWQDIFMLFDKAFLYPLLMCVSEMA